MRHIKVLTASRLRFLKATYIKLSCSTKAVEMPELYATLGIGPPKLTSLTG